MTIPADELQSLSPTAVIELFELDATNIPGGSLYRFHAGTNEIGTAIVWQGNSYTPYPIKAEGFEITTKGTLPRPSISVANVDGMLGMLVADLEDLIGAVVTRKRTLLKFLDAANFAGGNPDANPSVAYPDDIYEVERKISETKSAVVFELVASLDAHGQMLPKRIIQATICGWVYKGTECGYSGGLATCNKSYNSTSGDGGCRQHFPLPAALPFGGFLGASRIR